MSMKSGWWPTCASCIRGSTSCTRLFQNLKRRHSGSDIHKYADQPVLNEDISHVDEIYLWFVSLKDELNKQEAM